MNLYNFFKNQLIGIIRPVVLINPDRCPSISSSASIPYNVFPDFVSNSGISFLLLSRSINLSKEGSSVEKDFLPSVGKSPQLINKEEYQVHKGQLSS